MVELGGRGAGEGPGRGARALPRFGISVNSISTRRGGYYSPISTISLPPPFFNQCSERWIEDLKILKIRFSKLIDSIFTMQEVVAI